jgi:hypothetical protein
VPATETREGLENVGEQSRLGKMRSVKPSQPLQFGRGKFAGVGHRSHINFLDAASWGGKQHKREREGKKKGRRKKKKKRERKKEGNGSKTAFRYLEESQKRKSVW